MSERDARGGQVRRPTRKAGKRFCLAPGNLAVLGAWSVRLLAPRPAANGTPGVPTVAPVGGRSVTVPPQPAPGAASRRAKIQPPPLRTSWTAAPRPNASARIRLAAIDAPEDGQAFGTESIQHLSEFLQLSHRQTGMGGISVLDVADCGERLLDHRRHLPSCPWQDGGGCSPYAAGGGLHRHQLVRDSQLQPASASA